MSTCSFPHEYPHLFGKTALSELIHKQQMRKCFASEVLCSLNLFCFLPKKLLFVTYSRNHRCNVPWWRSTIPPNCNTLRAISMLIRSAFCIYCSQNLYSSHVNEKAVAPGATTRRRQNLLTFFPPLTVPPASGRPDAALSLPKPKSMLFEYLRLSARCAALRNRIRAAPFSELTRAHRTDALEPKPVDGFDCREDGGVSTK